MTSVKLSEKETAELINCIRQLVEKLPAVRVVPTTEDPLYTQPLTPQEVDAHNLRIANQQPNPRPYRIIHR